MNDMVSTAERAGLLSVLRYRDLRVLMTVFVIDQIGNWGNTVVLSAYLYARTGSVGWVAAIACTAWITKLVVSTPSGVLADTVDRVRLVAGSGFCCAVVMAGMAVVVGTDGPLLLVPVLCALDKALSGPVYAASGALLPDIVPEAGIVRANALLTVLENVVTVAGPAIGGVFVWLGAPAVAIGLNAASYLVAGALVLLVRTRSRGEVQASDRLLTQWAGGFLTLARHRDVLLLVFAMTTGDAVWGACVVLYGPMSERFGTGVNGFSYLLAASAAGGIAAAAVAGRLSAGRRLSGVVLGAVALTALPMAVTVPVHDPVTAAVLQLISGFGLTTLEVLAITAIQRRLRGSNLGRVLAATAALCLAATIAADLLTTLLLAAWGLSVALAVVGFGLPLLAALGAPALLRSDRHEPATAAERERIVGLLQRLDLFDGATRITLERLATAAVPHRSAAGEVIIAEGAPADALWLLESGELRVTVGGQVRPSVQGPAYVGEIGILHDRPRTATVTVAGPATLLRIAAAEFRAAVADSGVSSSLRAVAGDRLSVRTAAATTGPRMGD